METRSKRVVSKKIALFVMIIIFVPITIAYVTYKINNTAPKADDLLNYYYSINIPKSGQKVVCLMFDDGWQTQYNVAVPIMNKYSYKATFGIITSYVGNSWSSNYDTSYMSWNEIVELANNGEDIESHTYSHLNLNKLGTATIIFQLSQSKQDLFSHGINSTIFIYPDGSGAGNTTVENLIQNYYLLARSINPGVLNLSQQFDRYDLPSYTMSNITTLNTFEIIVNKAINSTIVILYYHKIDYENIDTAITPETFSTEMKYLHDNNFTVMTMKQLFLKVNA